MIALKREARTPRFVPDYIAKSLTDIDFNLLKRHGIKYIAFDADSTLVVFRGKTMLTASRKFLRGKRRLFRDWCIASNRITNDLQPLADSIEAKVVRATLFTRKPSKRFFDRVYKELNSKPTETAMIGDKLIADMWGAKRAGMTTIWVERLGNDNPLDRLFRTRQVERKLMRAYQPVENIKNIKK
jgi:HAD superfamily phosphatase (TIGR01668 family)